MFLLMVVVGGCEDDGWPICGDGNQEPGETCDDGNAESFDGCSRLCEIESAVEFTWRVTSVANGGSVTCPDGFDKATVAIGLACADVYCDPEPFVLHTADAACSAGRTTVQLALDHGKPDHRVSVRFENSRTGEIYGETPRRTVNLRLMRSSEHVIYDDAGIVNMVVEMFKGTTPASCFGVLTRSIRVTALPTSGPPIELEVPCSDPEGPATFIETAPLPAGTYSFVVSSDEASTTIENVEVAAHSNLSLGRVALHF